MTTREEKSAFLKMSLDDKIKRKRKENQTDEEYRQEVIEWKKKNIYKNKNMYLCIYKKKSNNGYKLYFATTHKLTDKIAITNQEFKTVVLGYKNKIQSYKFNEVSDLKRIYPELKEKYAGNIYVIENRYKDLTQIKLVVFLLGNPLWEVGLSKREETNEVEEGKCNTRTIEIESIEDWKLSEKEFDFQSDFIYDIFKGE